LSENLNQTHDVLSHDTISAAAEAFYFPNMGLMRDNTMYKQLLVANVCFSMSPFGLKTEPVTHFKLKNYKFLPTSLPLCNDYKKWWRFSLESGCIILHSSKLIFINICTDGLLIPYFSLCIAVYAL
jgi:hypothetical protein